MSVAVQQVADGVYRLGTKWVGWYLHDVDGAITVVDCGFSRYFEQLPAARRQDRSADDALHQGRGARGGGSDRAGGACRS
ncbi:MAG TPA: hypothetical protein VHH57_02070 [Gaiella sp.]|nr:hypothetical protein [Gaiella sp.]